VVHQGLGHSIPCSFIVMSSQDTSRVTHEPISTGFREAIQGNTRQYKAIRSEREIILVIILLATWRDLIQNVINNLL
jgi:hypothetical protein